MKEQPSHTTAGDHPVVFFDLDGTIAQDHPDEVTGRLLRLAVEEGVMDIDKSQIEELEQLRGTYGDRIDSSRQKYLQRLNETFDTHLYHKNVPTIKALAQELVRADQQNGIFYDEVLNELRDWQEQGATTAIISGSPDVYIQAFKKEYAIDIGTGTRHYHNGNTYHPQPAASRAKEKHLIVEKVLGQKTSRLGKIAYAAAAYGDTENDLSMLEAAHEPVVVNPKNGLATIALERGYRIINPKRIFKQEA